MTIYHWVANIGHYSYYSYRLWTHPCIWYHWWTSETAQRPDWTLPPVWQTQLDGSAPQKFTHLRPPPMISHLNQDTQHSKAIRFVYSHGHIWILVWIVVYDMHLWKREKSQDPAEETKNTKIVWNYQNLEVMGWKTWFAEMKRWRWKVSDRKCGSLIFFWKCFGKLDVKCFNR